MHIFQLLLSRLLFMPVASPYPFSELGWTETGSTPRKFSSGVTIPVAERNFELEGRIMHN